MLLLLPPLLAPGAPAMAQSGREVMEAVAARKAAEELSAVVEVVVTEAGTRRPRSYTLQMYERRTGNEVRTVMFVREPGSRRDDAYLGLDRVEPGREDQQWFHARRERATRPIEGEARAEPFLESDFSFADLTLPDLDAFRFRLLREPELDGMPTWQVEMVPRADAGEHGWSYVKSVLWVRKDNHVIVRALHWLPQQGRLKHFLVTALEQNGRQWVVTGQRMATLEGNRTVRATVVNLSGLSYDVSLKRGLFDPKRLRRGLK